MPGLWLASSFIVTNTLHGYLLASKRVEARQTISEHAVLSSRTYTLYLIGHLLNVFFFLGFVLSFFFRDYGDSSVLAMAVVGAAAEVVQAIVPARGQLRPYHDFFAYIMAFSMIAMTFMAASVIPLSSAVRLLCLALATTLVVLMIIVNLFDRKHFWKFQMVGVLIFYIELFIILWAVA